MFLLVNCDPVVGAKHSGDNTSKKYDHLCIRMLRPYSDDLSQKPKFTLLMILSLRLGEAFG
jgi:hypothetical protein